MFELRIPTAVSFVSFLAVDSVNNLVLSETCQFSHFELWVASSIEVPFCLSAGVIFVFSPLGFPCSPFILLPSSLFKTSPQEQQTILNTAFDAQTLNLWSSWIKVGDSRPVMSYIVGTHDPQVSLVRQWKASHLLISIAFPQMRWHTCHVFAPWTAFLHIHFCVHFPISRWAFKGSITGTAQ